MTSITDVCLSCLRKDHIYNIFDTHECEGNEEIYAEMLKTCFDISVSRKSNAKSMCEACIMKLRDAFYFKQKIFKNINQLESLRIQVELLEEAELDESEIFNDIETDLDANDMYLVVVKQELAENSNDVTKNEENNLLEEKPELTVQRYQKTYDKKKRNYKKSELKYEKENKEVINEQIVSYTENVLVSEESVKPDESLTPELPEPLEREPSEPLRPTSEHNIDEGTQAEPKTNDFTCEFCGKNFATKLGIRNHMSTHESGHFPCHICGKVFSKQNSRSCHTWRVHRTPAAYSCAECDDRFLTLHQKLAHMRNTHNMQPTLDCPYCDKTYFDSSTRSHHIRGTHLKVRNHKCSKCKMAFFKRRLLLNHLATMHGIGAKNYACHVCNKTFYMSTTLNYHMKRHDIYHCDICDKTFNFRSYKTHSHEPEVVDVWTIEQSVGTDGQVEGSNITVESDDSNV